MAGISFKSVSHAYGKKVVFENLSTEITGNKLTCLLGSTGCGKTTILRLIAGLETPTKGIIQIGGKVVTDNSGILVSPSGRGVGLIFQDLALWPHFTVFKNIAWGLKIRKSSHIDEKVFDMLELFNIRALSDRYPHQLSGGQQQLVALARSLVLDPKILMMDEPLSNLDSKMKAKVIHYIVELKEQFNITIVYVTHDHRDAEALADEVILLSDTGNVLISGEKKMVLGSDEFRGEFMSS